MTSSSSKTFHVKGWPAAVAVAVVVLAGGFKYAAATSSLEAEGLAAVKLRLAGEYAARGVGSLEDAMRQGDFGAATRRAEELGKLEAISFVSTRSRGLGNERVVRLDIRVAGEPPPDGRTVRYFLLEHSLLTGWRVSKETTAWAYYLRWR